jgi:hypothetical protein
VSVPARNKTQVANIDESTITFSRLDREHQTMPVSGTFWCSDGGDSSGHKEISIGVAADSRSYLTMADFPPLFRRFLAIVLLLTGLGVGAWLQRKAILQGLADLWIVSDPVTPGDAVVVLGGGLDLRPFVAADLYRKGLAGRILVSQVVEGRSVSIGKLPGHTELNRAVLLNLGVPDSAIESFGTANRNTMEEALVLRDWAERNGASVLIIPTEIFAARRVSWIFRREFSGKNVRIEVQSVEPEDYTRAGWWKSEQGLITFQNELLKYIYYRMKY